MDTMHHAPSSTTLTDEDVLEHLHDGHRRRGCSAVYEAAQARACPLDVIHDITKIDWWFLDKLQESRRHRDGRWPTAT